MSLFVDTSVWSLLLRRDRPAELPQVDALTHALLHGERVVTTGVVLQELLQGFSGPKAGEQIVARFAALPFVSPTREDHVAAAGLRNRCRKAGVQLGTIDSLIGQLCLHHELTLLTTDEDFGRLAKLSTLRLWTNSRRP